MLQTFGRWGSIDKRVSWLQALQPSLHVLEEVCVCVHKMLIVTFLYSFFYFLKSQNGVLGITAMRRGHKIKGFLTKAHSPDVMIIAQILVV